MCSQRFPLRDSNDGKLLILVSACAGGAILGALAVVGFTSILASVVGQPLPTWTHTPGVWLGMAAGAGWLGKAAFIEFFR